MANPRNTRRDFMQDAAIRAVLRLALGVPYRWRVPAVGWLAARVMAPLVGWRARVAGNLALVRPDLTAAEVRQLQIAVADNLGRTVIELYSGREFHARAGATPFTGPGRDAFLAARAEGRPVVLVTGHIGNFQAVRVALAAQGHPMAGLYRPMHNRLFNAHYVRAMEAIGRPMFPTTLKGIAAFIRYLRTGGIAGVLIDVYTQDGAPLTFFGRTAPTALSAARWAIQAGALIQPVYGLRTPDGLGFTVQFEAPIPHGEPAAMMQTLNDSIERQVRANMGQYLWTHQRWKTG